MHLNPTDSSTPPCRPTGTGEAAAREPNCPPHEATTPRAGRAPSKRESGVEQVQRNPPVGCNTLKSNCFTPGEHPNHISPSTFVMTFHSDRLSLTKRISTISSILRNLNKNNRLVLLIVIRQRKSTTSGTITTSSNQRKSDRIKRTVLTRRRQKGKRRNLLIARSDNTSTLGNRNSTMMNNILLLSSNMNKILSILNSALLNDLILRVTIGLTRNTRQRTNGLNTKPDSRLKITILTRSMDLGITQVSLSINARRLLRAANIRRNTKASGITLKRTKRLSNNMNRGISQIKSSRRSTIRTKLLGLESSKLGSISILISRIRTNLTKLLDDTDNSSSRNNVNSVEMVTDMSLRQLNGHRTIHSIRNLTLNTILIRISRSRLKRRATLRRYRHQEQASRATTSGDSLLLIGR